MGGGSGFKDELRNPATLERQGGGKRWKGGRGGRVHG